MQQTGRCGLSATIVPMAVGREKSVRRAGAPGPQVLTSKKFAGLPWLVHGFSTRKGGLSDAYGEGDLNLGFTRDDPRTNVEENRTAFLKALGAVGRRGKHWPLVTLKQVHSPAIHHVTSVPDAPLVGDGLITERPGIVLAVQAADCVPVLVADPEHRAVGAFHAGWRGTLARIVERGIGEMRRCFGSRPEQMRAAIGPAIHRCCYEVSDELRDRFESQFAYAADLFEEVVESDPVRERHPLLFLTARAPGHHDLGRKPHLDLIGANRRQLLDAGLAARNIEASPLCTSCHTRRLFSHRAEKGKTGRMMAAIGLRP